MSYARTTLLLAALTALFMGVGWLIGGMTGMVIALMAAVAMNGFAYWNSGTMVLRMYGAKPADPANAPMLIKLVEQLSYRAGIPAPRVYIIDNPQPNAFATGRNPEHAAIAATTGLLQHLGPEETAGVIAHELAHVRNRDTLIMTVTATIAGAITMLSQLAFFMGARNSRDNPLGPAGLILVMIVGPMAAMLVQMAISRTREYEADRIGAEICGHPMWLANALTRLGEMSGRIENKRAEKNPATAHLFIVNPLRGRSLRNLFSTHPSLKNRVARLHKIANNAEHAAKPAGPAN
ncbi:MAG: zinc metalloprotease HtpX [Alphaproteobacteria bacterium]|jgi:heat shock protein HtpX|nr:zinc metalloprotease HtpX [Alphaproteobacteria bacterium]